MICPRCKGNVLDGSTSCVNCGYNFSMNNNQNNNFVQQNNMGMSNNFMNNNQNTNMNSNISGNFNNSYNGHMNNNTNKKGNNGIAIVISIVIVVVIGIFSYNFLMKNKNVNNDNNKQHDVNKANNNSNDNSNNNDSIDDKYTPIDESIAGKVEPGTNLTYDENGAFLLYIDDVFTRTGVGTFVTGTVTRGTVKPGDKLQIVGLDKKIINTEAVMLENVRKTMESAKIGDSVGILLKNVTKEQVLRGQVIAKPNSIKATNYFEATIDVLDASAGNRNNSIDNGYKGYMIFNPPASDGVITLLGSTKVGNPGDKDIKVKIKLDKSLPMEVGNNFIVSKNSLGIALGKVTKMY